MKVSELEGEELDYWAAKALDVGEVLVETHGAHLINISLDGEPFYPSQAWVDGGPIIAQENIAMFEACGEWNARCASGNVVAWKDGPTPLIAAMRAFVASKYGEEVPSEPLSELVAQAQELDMGY